MDGVLGRAAGLGKLPVCGHLSVRKRTGPFECVGRLELTSGSKQEATQGNMQSTLNSALCVLDV